MRRLRLLVLSATLMAALFLGSGVASAGMAWCDVGSPPPMDTPTSGGYLAPNPQLNPNGMPTPLFKDANGKFTPNPVVPGALLPPGMTQAASGK